MAPVTTARAAARRRQLGLVAVIGIGLFYAFMLFPARLQQMISIVTLDAPDQAVAYGVGYPYFTVLDAVMLAWGLLSWALFGASRRAWSPAVLAYVGVSIVSAGIAYFRFSAGLEDEFFADGLLGGVRLFAAYALFAGVPSGEERWGRRLQEALAVLFVTSLLLNLAGFQNRATWSNEAGRLTASGLDFATTSYYGAVLAIAAMTMSRGRRRQVLMAAGLLGLAMGGGRIAVTMAALTIGAMMLGSRPAVRRVLVQIGLVGAGLAVVVALVFPEVLDRIPTLRRGRDDAAYYQQLPRVGPMALRYFPFLEAFDITQPAVVGRFNTWASALQLLENREGQPASSDWLVQRGLAPLGVPSHSHNAYLQSALKFGPLALIVWLPLFVSAWRGLLRRSPYGPLLFLLLVSLAFDYWMLVAKALFLLYAFAALNDRWLAEHPRKRGTFVIDASLTNP